MDTIKVAAALDSLFCFHGADEEASEPYLWTILFTLDGKTITHAPDAPRLTGKPAIFFGPGSHGNIGGSVNSGITRQIPREVGRFDTTLQPIVLRAFGRSLEVPGQLGLIGILLEENSTSDIGADAAHQAVNDLVKRELEAAVAGVDLAAVAAQAAPAIQAGTDPLVAVLPIFQSTIDDATERIQASAQDVARAAIIEKMSLPGALIEGLDPDEFMGTSINFFSQTHLQGTTHQERSKFTDRIAQPGLPEASDFVYNLHGQVWQPVEVFFTPVTDQVPPGRHQVTGATRGFTAHKSFISHLGGSFPDGTPWALKKGTVMDLMRAGSHTFFVRGSSGVEADVIADPQEDNPFFPFLTTTPDDDPTNNLTTLPPAVLQLRHVRDVPS
jgi:hypothetical protein